MVVIRGEMDLWDRMNEASFARDSFPTLIEHGKLCKETTFGDISYFTYDCTIKIFKMIIL